MSERVSVIGDGAMGTICAIMLAENGHRVRLWSAFPAAAEALAASRENRRFLPGVKLPDSIEVTGRDEEALAGAAMAISAVPTQFMRSVWSRLAGHCSADLTICSVTKGIENHTLLCPSGILQDVLHRDGDRIVVLSGPSIAPEIASHQPATVAVAGQEALAEWVQRLISRPYFRVYTNPDMVGVEIAGATKNVIAIAAGMLDGLEYGSNAKAALLTRGLAEITRLGRKLGAQAATFAGLAGVGDLVTTCISPVGRNRLFGEALGRGETVEQALGATDSVVEGAATTASVMALAQREQIDMPITQAVAAVLDGRLTPRQAVDELMQRPLKAETGEA
jgi:glycerol-3-phosphate dehydrogenase (NAD(P)+)